MSDKKITIISETDDLSQRILEVNAGLSKWLTSQCDYNSKNDVLIFVKSEKQKKSYVYQYELLKGEDFCSIPSKCQNLSEKQNKIQEWALGSFENSNMQESVYC